MTRPVHPRVYELLDEVADAAMDAKRAARDGDGQLVHVFTRKAMQCSDLACWWWQHPEIMESQERARAEEAAKKGGGHADE